ncbi:LAMI_0G02080g1_1 [Lachancea mirantina]|uniref:Topoisomerase I damage affected protein 11 n=1 Tax=Lachancea mirantina TaxID=1230905 RepID=A0A1G4K7P3_9SACH|nr:LAMI_0G02080g1_1 [Lachancea mirantina]
MRTLEEFLDSTDREMQIDTGVRTGALQSPLENSPPFPTAQTAQRRSWTVSHTTPSRASERDHPLKDTPPGVVSGSGGSGGPAVKFGRSNTLKRKSLLQPIISPSPHNKPQEHKVQLRARSGSNASRRSRTSSLHSDELPSEPDVSTLLQVLASKEQELLEAKRRIEELKKSLFQEEHGVQARQRELQDLKRRVSLALIENEAKVPTPKAPLPADSSESGKIATQGTPNDDSAQKESVWSKPLSLFNQFDQLIQHELEKKLHWDDVEGGSNSPQKDSASGNNAQPQVPDDVMGNVSTSLWNFVTDMKAGLLGIEEETTNSSTESKRQDAKGQQGPSSNHLKFVNSGDSQKDQRQDRSSSAEVELIEFRKGSSKSRSK